MTVDEEAVAEFGRMLDAYAARVRLAKYLHAESDPDEVPAAMWTGDVFPIGGTGARRFATARELLAAMQGDDGFDAALVGWRMLPSTVTEAEVAAVEAEIGAPFPPPYRAYLRARSHLLEGFRSRRHGTSISLPPLPPDQPLAPLRKLLRDWGWQLTVPAGFLPCGAFGDEEWGGLFFDTGRRRADGDCPVVCIDHECLVPLAEGAENRERLLRDADTLYDSSGELFADMLTPAEPGAAPDPARM